jgi:hypothetical protein
MGKNLLNNHRILNAMIRTAPPQAGQVSMSMPKTRFRRCAQVIAARRSAGVSIGTSETLMRSSLRDLKSTPDPGSDESSTPETLQPGSVWGASQSDISSIRSEGLSGL